LYGNKGITLDKYKTQKISVSIPLVSTLKVPLLSGTRVALKHTFILRCADKA